MNFSDWIQTFEDLLNTNIASWDGMLLLAGDINLDMFHPEMSEVKRHNELLDSLNLKQMVTKATRISKTSKTLIDHIITNTPKRITYTEVLPCPLVSDHDAPYVCVNGRITRYTPRHKLIRNEKRFFETAFIDDFAFLPFEIVYAFDDPNDKIATFNTLVTVSRQTCATEENKGDPTPCTLAIGTKYSLFASRPCNQRLEAHARPPKESARDMFRHTRNKLKKSDQKGQAVV